MRVFPSLWAAGALVLITLQLAVTAQTAPPVAPYQLSTYATGPGNAYDLVVAPTGDLFVLTSEPTCDISRITSDRQVAKFAGQGCNSVETNGVGEAGTFYDPRAIAITADGSKLFVTTVYGIRQIVVATAAVSNLAGGGVTTFDKGYKDGSASTAQFMGPAGLVVSADQTQVVVCDISRVRTVNIATGLVGTLAGTDNPHYHVADGIGTAALLGYVSNIVVSSTGDFIVVDFDEDTTGDFLLRKVTLAGVVTTVGWIDQLVINVNDIAVSGGSIYIVDGVSALYVWNGSLTTVSTDARYTDAIGLAVFGATLYAVTYEGIVTALTLPPTTTPSTTTTTPPSTTTTPPSTSTKPSTTTATPTPPTPPAPTPANGICPATTGALDQDAAPSSFKVTGSAVALNSTSFAVTVAVTDRPSLASRVVANETLYPRVLLASTQGSGALTTLTAQPWQTFWATDDYNGTWCTATLTAVLDWRAPSCNLTHCFVNVSTVVPVYGVPTLFQSTQRTFPVPIPYAPITVSVGATQGVRLACSANVNTFACALAPMTASLTSVAIYAIATNSWITSCSVVAASNIIVCVHTASVAQVYNASLLLGTAPYGSLAFNSTPVSIPLPPSVGSGSVAVIPLTYALASAAFTYTQAVQVNLQCAVNFVVTSAWIVDEFGSAQFLPVTAIWNATLNATAVAVYLNVAALRPTKANIMLQSWPLYVGVRIFTSSSFADERRFVSLQAGGSPRSQVVATTALTVTPGAGGSGAASTPLTVVPPWGIATAAVGGLVVVGCVLAVGVALKKRSAAADSFAETAPRV